ncbi:MAG: molybdopterin-dependent oxidoreductase, partial [Actinomycetota bacterium]|nr:molybdopterin-dependent oxidoreductase [Actinomycetota bacterium]
ESVAVCLLFAFRDPSHERAVADALRARHPHLHVVASHELAPEFREYERASTTAVDAYLSPVSARYFASLRRRCEKGGLPEPLVMRSSGGVATLDEAAAHAALVLVSGPAAGVVGAARLAREVGVENAITFDMGGTSTDVCLIADGSAERSTERAVGGVPVRLPTVDVPAPALPRGVDLGVRGVTPFVTQNDAFYRVDTALLAPRLRAEDWRLRIHGMVDRETTLSFSDLTSRRLVERPLTMTCVSNEIGGPYISTANFTGVLLADILADVGVQRGADQAFTTSVDGWTCGTPTAALTDPAGKAMLVIGMNGEPLPIEHGFPVRMVVPGLYGYVSATKWITDLELTTFQARQAYWLQRGWGRRAPIKTMSRIDSPGPFERVSPDTSITGIDKVEVRIDHGAWRPAELSVEVSVDTWRMFRLQGRWEPGAHVAEVRATDKSGYTQTADRAAPIPDGATGWHSVQFTVQ